MCDGLKKKKTAPKESRNIGMCDLAEAGAALLEEV